MGAESSIPEQQNYTALSTFMKVDKVVHSRAK